MSKYYKYQFIWVEICIDTFEIYTILIFNYCDTYLNNCVTQYINTYLKIHKYTGNRPPCSYWKISSLQYQKVTQDLGNIVSITPVVNTGSSVNVNVSDINIANVSTTGLLSNVISTVTDTVSHTTTDLVSNVVGTVTGTVGSTNPIDTVTNIIGGVTGGVTGNPLEVVTDIIGGVTGGVVGGTSPISPVIDVVQGGIDILQGVESLKLKLLIQALKL